MEQRRREATVTQVNNFLKVLLERTDALQNLWVKGEISNFKFHSSGHIYLTLKDEGAVLRAVMFKSAAMKLAFRPENGMKVAARGRIAVFERDGQYQLYIEEMEQEGRGDLYRLFEELKKKLGDEGLFDSAKKRPIPPFPTKIGIVTSPTGAAVRDIINILKRRYPIAEARLYPALVQGVSASASIVKGIEYFNQAKCADVLIVGRGGGSIEDLWAFNEEATVRAVRSSEIPVISAVGHETDFTLTDFAADLRAPTPSAAAELAVPNSADIRAFVETSEGRMKNLLLTKAENRERQLALLSQRASRASFERKIQTLALLCDRAADNLTKEYEKALTAREKLFSQSASKLDALSPLKVFSRGYSVAEKDGKAIVSVDDVKKGDKISVVVTDGTIEAEVSALERKMGYVI